MSSENIAKVANDSSMQLMDEPAEITTEHELTMIPYQEKKVLDKYEGGSSQDSNPGHGHSQNQGNQAFHDDSSSQDLGNALTANDYYRKKTQQQRKEYRQTIEQETKQENSQFSDEDDVAEEIVHGRSSKMSKQGTGSKRQRDHNILDEAEVTNDQLDFRQQVDSNSTQFVAKQKTKKQYDSDKNRRPRTGYSNNPRGSNGSLKQQKSIKQRDANYEDVYRSKRQTQSTRGKRSNKISASNSRTRFDEDREYDSRDKILNVARSSESEQDVRITKGEDHLQKRLDQIKSPESDLRLADKRLQAEELKKKFFKGDMDQDEIKEKLNSKLVSMFQYRSRMQQQFSDEESQDNASDENPYNDFSGMRTGKKFLEGQREFLKIQMEKNEHLTDIERQKELLGANADSDVKPNKLFKNFNELFANLIRSKNVVTMYPIVSVILTYNSKRAITVTKRNDSEYWIKQYCLDTYDLTMEEKLGGKTTDYIKLKEVEQNSTGEKFAVTYFNDGRFYLRTFGYEPRTLEEVEADEVDINSLIEPELNNYTMAIHNFPDPYINCCFIRDDLIFVQFLYNYGDTPTHYHFFWNTKERKVDGEIFSRELQGATKTNFPYKCFYNDEDKEVYGFYRQGQVFNIPVHQERPNQGRNLNESLINIQDTARSRKRFNLQEVEYEKIAGGKDLGQMYLINNKALVVRSSQQVLFYKITADDFTGERKWENYHTLNIKGFIYFIKGNKRIQLTTDTHIYFYMINAKTFEPELENVMANFMNCNQMMFGSKVRYCITYKTNQKSFDIYRRKYEHDYKVNVVTENYDGSQGLALESMNAFLVSKLDKIYFYDIDSYKRMKECDIQVPLLKAEGREPNEIISLSVSHCENFLACISGKNLIKNQQQANQLFVFQRIRNFNSSTLDKWNLVKRIVLKDRPEDFNGVCMEFHFKHTKNGKEPVTIIFARTDAIIELNWNTEAVTVTAEFEVPLTRQSEYFQMNDDQTVAIIASTDDGIYYNHRSKVQVDLDELYSISNIKEIIHDHEDRCFYLLCNKFEGKLGLFLIRFDEFDPTKHEFFMRWKNKLDIADANIYVIRDEENHAFKELIVSYKTIFMNTYNIIVIDISTSLLWMLFRHESFQLWESQVTGHFIKKHKNFLTLNRDGISMYGLGLEDKRAVQSEDKSQDMMLHNLASTSYLKIDSKNMVLFEFSNSEQKTISIMQQHTRKNQKSGDETHFESVYNIKIFDITLRELLLLQSLYVSKTSSDIVELVKAQPKPLVFYKSFLEFDGVNIVSILSFDSRAMAHLLDQKYNIYFDPAYPIFYKNKIVKSNNIEKFFYRSAIDTAIKTNQIRAVGEIINYVVNYQNNYVSSFLFNKNLPALIQKGVEVAPLLNSDIFCYKFDCDEWPSTHKDSETYMKPYNASIFELRENYNEIFEDEHLQINYNQEEEDIIEDSSKMYKIMYKVNMLPILSEHIKIDEQTGEKKTEKEGVYLLQYAADSEELEVFESENFQILINFKWDEFARNVHLISCLFHFLYVFILTLYVYEIYIIYNEENMRTYQILLLVGVAYPAIYDFRQFYQMGLYDYLSDVSNYSDLVYIWGSVANAVMQNSFSPFHIANKIFMTLIFLNQIVKTFFFLRIFEELSYIVTMITQVFYDLKVFLLFYTILLCFFSLIFAVIGVGNPAHGELKAQLAEWDEWPDQAQPFDTPGEEYGQIGLLLGYFFYTLRSSLGDFDFDASAYLEGPENYLFWFYWLLMVGATCIIFLNFIIAETSNSYQKIKDRMTAQLYKEKTALVSEAQLMLFSYQRDTSTFPQYIVVREKQQ